MPTRTRLPQLLTALLVAALLVAAKLSSQPAPVQAEPLGQGIERQLAPGGARSIGPLEDNPNAGPTEGERRACDGLAESE